MTSYIYCKCYWELRCTKMGKYTVQSGKWSAIRYQSETNRFCKKGVLKDIAKFTGEQLHQRLFLNKVAGLRPATLFKKRLWHRCFPVNFAKFLRTPFSQNTSWRLLLNQVTNLKSLGFTQKKIANLLGAFPEVVLCDIYFSGLIF